ncbi:MAG: type II secretion system protein [Candidatus Levybacteria bacterium]|nr:type II secretion system protein [Candidatus Levybacteria bacterium]
MKGIGKGFTLIELLVAIAMLGVLATGVLVAINPLERLALARDAQRKTAISQLARALQSYYINHAATSNPFPPNSYTFMNALVADGDLRTVLPMISNTTACLGGVYSQNNFCYYNDGANAYTMVHLESQKEKSRCSADESPYYIWDFGRGKIGVVCVGSLWCIVGGCTFLP